MAADGKSEEGAQDGGKPRINDLEILVVNGEKISETLVFNAMNAKDSNDEGWTQVRRKNQKKKTNNGPIRLLATRATSKLHAQRMQNQRSYHVKGKAVMDSPVLEHAWTPLKKTSFAKKNSTTQPKQVSAVGDGGVVKGGE